MCVHKVLNGGADVFRCIAAEWKSVEPETVQDCLRQQAKQVLQEQKGTVAHGFSLVSSPGCTHVDRSVTASSMEWEQSLWGSRWEWRRTTQPATLRALKPDTKVCIIRVTIDVLQVLSAPSFLFLRLSAPPQRLIHKANGVNLQTSGSAGVSNLHSFCLRCTI